MPAGLDVPRPWIDDGAEGYGDAGFEAPQPALLHQIEAKLAETEPCLVIAEFRPQHGAEHGVGMARRVAVAVLQAEVCHAADDERAQVLAGVPSRRHHRGEDVHRLARDRIGHPRQVEQRLDRALTELPPHPLVFLPNLLLCRMRRPSDTDAAQVAEGHLDGAVAPAEGREQLHLQPRNGGQIGEAGGAVCKFSKPLLRFSEFAGEELAFGPVELEREGEFGPALPGVLQQERRTGGEIGQCRGIGGCLLGAPARKQVQLGQLLALVSQGDQGRAAVELVDDVEDRLLPLLGRCVRREQSSDSKVRLATKLLRDQRIGGLLYAIVAEPVGAREALDQFLTNGRPQRHMDLLLRSLENNRKCRELGDVSQTRQLLQRLPRLDRQAGELADHQVHDVVTVSLGMYAIEIPAPTRRIMIKGEHSLFGERRQELNGEERIATRLLVHQLRQRRGALRRAAECVRHHLPEMLPGERRQRDLCYHPAGALDGVQFSHQRMAGGDFVVAIGSDQHEVLQIRAGQQILQQIERRRVEPLQVVKEEYQWMFRPGEDADEAPEHQLEAALCLLWFKRWDRGLLTDDELQLGDEVDHELAVRAQRLQKGIAPAGQLGLALRQKAPGQALKRLRECRIGDVALVLVELARGKQPARRHQHFVQLVDHGGLADAGIAGHQDQLRGATLGDAIERGEQGRDLVLAPVQLLGDQQPVRQVLRPQREGLNAALRVPCGEAAPQVVREAGGGLVALLGGLGEQLHHDGGQRLGDLFHAFGERHRPSCDVAVHPSHRIGRRKRQNAGEHLVEGDTQRVQVAAGVDRAVHAAGLFRRHVGEGAGNSFGRLGAPAVGAAGARRGRSRSAAPLRLR